MLVFILNEIEAPKLTDFGVASKRTLRGVVMASENLGLILNFGTE
jgi:hypothetical protein